MNVYDVIRRPLITEKAHGKREGERTMCFEVHPDANKIQIKQAVETVFRVSDWKKAYVRIQAGEKIPEYSEI